MTMGLMLLTAANVYVSNEGEMPERPKWDKGLITDIIRGQRVLCSVKTLKTLPESMLNAAYFTSDPRQEHDINFGVATFRDAPVDILIVVRSSSNLKGKRFSLSDYKLIRKVSPSFEMYRRIR